MPNLKIILDGTGAWPDLRPGGGGRFVMADNDGQQVALLKGGMESGKCSVMFRLELPGGPTVLAETSLGLLENAVRAMRSAAGVEG